MASGIARSRGSKDVTLLSLHLVTPPHWLSSRAVSPFVVPNTTSLVALVKRESLPQLFQHKLTELSPSGANWGHASSPPPGISHQLRQRRGLQEAQAPPCPPRGPQKVRLSEEGGGHCSPQEPHEGGELGQLGLQAQDLGAAAAARDRKEQTGAS